MVVLGRSRIVGQPLAYMLTTQNALVTIVHSGIPSDLLETAVKVGAIVWGGVCVETCFSQVILVRVVRVVRLVVPPTSHVAFSSSSHPHLTLSLPLIYAVHP